MNVLPTSSASTGGVSSADTALGPGPGGQTGATPFVGRVQDSLAFTPPVATPPALQPPSPLLPACLEAPIPLGRKWAAGTLDALAPPALAQAPHPPEGQSTRTSWLAGTRMPPLLLSQSLERGSFGKFRLAADPCGALYAVKEMRTHAWRGRATAAVGARRPYKTLALSRAAIV